MELHWTRSREVHWIGQNQKRNQCNSIEKNRIQLNTSMEIHWKSNEGYFIFVQIKNEWNYIEHCSMEFCWKNNRVPLKTISTIPVCFFRFKNTNGIQLKASQWHSIETINGITSKTIYIIPLRFVIKKCNYIEQNTVEFHWKIDRIQLRSTITGILLMASISENQLTSIEKNTQWNLIEQINENTLKRTQQTMEFHWKANSMELHWCFQSQRIHGRPLNTHTMEIHWQKSMEVDKKTIHEIPLSCPNSKNTIEFN